MYEQQHRHTVHYLRANSTSQGEKSVKGFSFLHAPCRTIGTKAFSPTPKLLARSSIDSPISIGYYKRIMSSEVRYNIRYHNLCFIKQSLDFSTQLKTLGHLFREFLLYIRSKYWETTLYNNDECFSHFDMISTTIPPPQSNNIVFIVLKPPFFFVLFIISS